MKQRLLFLCLMVFLFLLSGCSLTRQPEHQSYVISLGVDLTADGQYQLSVQVPTIGGKGTSSPGSASQGSAYEVFVVKGESIPVALDLLKATMPSRLQLSLTKSIAVSEELARSPAFPTIVDELTMAYQIYGSAAVIIVQGQAKAFLEAQTPAIGIRLSSSVTAALEQYHNNGYVPLSTLYGLFCSNHSLYSDPVLTLAATMPQSSGAKSTPSHQGRQGEVSPDPAGKGSAPMSNRGDAFPADLPRSGPNRNNYMGCALIGNGIMVGTLDGESYRWLSMLRHEVSEISYQSQGQAVHLERTKPARVTLDLSPGQVSFHVALSFASSPLLYQPDLKIMEEEIRQDITSVIRRCQQAGVEPFNYAELVASRFATMEEFAAYGFREKFCRAPFTVQVSVEPSLP